MNGINKRREPPAPAVVITGATQGIGRALAEEFAREGHALLLVARDEAKLAETARELSSSYGVEVKVFGSDLITAEGCAAVEEALGRFGLYTDILVNNAAIMRAGFFQDEDLVKLKQLVDLDVRAVVDLTRRFLPGMIARRRGGVLNVASVEGFMPVPYQATYAAAKAFILSFSRALSYETMYTGVRISVLAPGTTATELHAKAGAEHSRYVALLSAMSTEELARFAHRKFKRGKKVIVPGWFNRLGVFVRRFVPDLLLVPFMGLLFRVRDAEGNLQWPKPLPRPDATTPDPAKGEPGKRRTAKLAASGRPGASR
jgi:short-subunit dehydrogenase